MRIYLVFYTNPLTPAATDPYQQQQARVTALPPEIVEFDRTDQGGGVTRWWWWWWWWKRWLPEAHSQAALLTFVLLLRR